MKHKYATCQECVELLFDYLEANLDPSTLKELDEHLSACPPCVNFLRTYQSCLAMGHQLREQRVQIPVEMIERLKSFLKEELRGSAG
ncbi:MAG: anti-sigma factor family protein [Acidobacteriota bacterium]